MLAECVPMERERERAMAHSYQVFVLMKNERGRVFGLVEGEQVVRRSLLSPRAETSVLFELVESNVGSVVLSVG